MPATEVADAPTTVTLTEGPGGDSNQNVQVTFQPTVERVGVVAPRIRSRYVSSTVLWILRYGISEGRIAAHVNMWLKWSILARHPRMRDITHAEVQEMIPSTYNWNYRRREPYILTRWVGGEDWYKAAHKAIY